jgi:hypothetical protein
LEYLLYEAATSIRKKEGDIRGKNIGRAAATEYGGRNNNK